MNSQWFVGRGGIVLLWGGLGVIMALDIFQQAYLEVLTPRPHEPALLLVATVTIGGLLGVWGWRTTRVFAFLWAAAIFVGLVVVGVSAWLGWTSLLWPSFAVVCLGAITLELYVWSHWPEAWWRSLRWWGD